MAELEKGIYMEQDVDFQLEPDAKPNPKKEAEV
jgi:hypothetical protein